MGREYAVFLSAANVPSKVKSKEKFIMRLGPTELIIVLAIVLILFGPSQLPKLTKMFRKSAKNFREGMEDGNIYTEEDEEDI